MDTTGTAHLCKQFLQPFLDALYLEIAFCAYRSLVLAAGTNARPFSINNMCNFQVHVNHFSLAHILHGKDHVVEWDSLILRGDPNSPLAPGRPITDGVLRTVCLVLSCSFSPCVPVGGGLHSSRWLEVDVCLDRIRDRWGVVAWEFFTRLMVTCGALLESP